MSTALCTTCFLNGDNREVHTIIPIAPCEECGATDNRWKGGPKVNLFPSDPRQKEDDGKET